MMKRSELIEIIKTAAGKSSLPEEATEKLVAAVSNPRITSVSRGQWVSPYGDCACPAVLAGLADRDGYNKGWGVMEFVGAFDALTRNKAPYKYIRIED
jgi:hypothetical protein